MRVVAGIVVWVILLTSLAGCSKPVGQVTGKVTLKGEPVAGADVMFQSVAEANDQFFGNSGEGGAYAVSYREYKGLPVGSYRVVVTRFTQTDGKSLPGGEQGRVLKTTGNVAKKAYQFEKEIAAGDNTLDFELTQGKVVAAD